MDKVNKQSGLYPNKTKRFLLPCVRAYGDEFNNKLLNVFKVAVGIGDMVVTNNGVGNYEKHLFILLDSSKASKFFIDFLLWIREQYMYEDDYVYGNIQKSTYHMIIIKFPEKYYNALSNFKEGKYSYMFNTPEEDIFKELRLADDVKSIITKNNNYKVVFTEKLNKIFNTTLTPEEIEGELELPPTPKTEIFNHHFLKQK